MLLDAGKKSDRPEWGASRLKEEKQKFVDCSLKPDSEKIHFQPSAVTILHKQLSFSGVVCFYYVLYFSKCPGFKE